MVALAVPNKPQTISVQVPVPQPVQPKPKQQVQQPQPRQPKLKGGIKTAPSPAYQVLPFSFGSDNRKNKRDGKATHFALDEKAFHKHIAEDPTDHLRWHVYADALQDAGRDREAEMIRSILTTNPTIGISKSSNPKKMFTIERDNRFDQDSAHERVGIFVPALHKKKTTFIFSNPKIKTDQAASIIGNLTRSGYEAHPSFLQEMQLLKDGHPEHFHRGQPSRFMSDESPFHDSRYEEENYHTPSQEDSFLDHIHRQQHYQDPTVLGAYADYLEEREPHRQGEIQMLRRAFVDHLEDMANDNSYIISSPKSEYDPTDSVAYYPPHHDVQGRHTVEYRNKARKDGSYLTFVTKFPQSEQAAELVSHLLRSGASHYTPGSEELVNQLKALHPEHFQEEVAQKNRRRGQPSRFAEEYQAERPDAHYKVMKKLIPNFDKSFRLMQKQNPEGKAISVKPDSDFAKHYTRYGHNLIGLHDESGNLRQLGLLHRDPNQQYADQGEHGQPKEGVKMTLIGHHEDSQRAKEHIDSYLNGFSGYNKNPSEQGSGTLGLLHEAGNLARDKGDLSYFPGIDHLKEGDWHFDDEQNYYQPPKNLLQMDNADRMNHRSIHENAGKLRQYAQKTGQVTSRFHHDMKGQRYFTIAHPDGRTVTRMSTIDPLSGESHAEAMGYHNLQDAQKKLGEQGQKFDKARMLMQLEHAEKTGNLHFPRYEQPKAKEAMKRGRPTRFSAQEEAAFHRAIEDNPEDKVQMQVFADWLEEQGRNGEAIAARKGGEKNNYGNALGTFRVIPAWDEFQDHFQVDFSPLRRKIQTRYGSELRKLPSWGRVLIYRRMKHDPSKVLETYAHFDDSRKFRDVVHKIRQSGMEDRTSDSMKQVINKGLNLKPKETMSRGKPTRMMGMGCFSPSGPTNTTFPSYEGKKKKKKEPEKMSEGGFESEESQFHRNLEENEKDPTSWLAYSDWLEEHGRDTEAQLMRIRGKDLLKPRQATHGAMETGHVSKPRGHIMSASGRPDHPKGYHVSFRFPSNQKNSRLLHVMLFGQSAKKAAQWIGSMQKLGMEFSSENNRELEDIQKQHPEHFRRGKPQRMSKADTQKFIDHIAEDPYDQTQHAVFADHLEEEYNSPLAEKIRDFGVNGSSNLWWNPVERGNEQLNFDSVRPLGNHEGIALFGEPSGHMSNMRYRVHARTSPRNHNSPIWHYNLEYSPDEFVKLADHFDSIGQKQIGDRIRLLKYNHENS